MYLARVKGEMQEVYRGAGDMTFAGLKQQLTLENAVRECERLHPPLIILMRKALKPMAYRDHIVPAGTLAQGVARIYERFHGKRLRRRCREALVGRIRWELRSSGHTSISPVSGFLNILALWLLCNTQDADGTWPKQDMAGVFFRTALLDYALYRQYFPLHALALYEARRRTRTRRAGSGLSEARHDLGQAQREQEGPGCQGELQSSAVGSQA